MKHISYGDEFGTFQSYIEGTPVITRTITTLWLWHGAFCAKEWVFGKLCSSTCSIFFSFDKPDFSRLIACFALIYIMMIETLIKLQSIFWMSAYLQFSLCDWLSITVSLLISCVIMFKDNMDRIDFEGQFENWVC